MSPMRIRFKADLSSGLQGLLAQLGKETLEELVAIRSQLLLEILEMHVDPQSRKLALQADDDIKPSSGRDKLALRQPSRLAQHPLHKLPVNAAVRIRLPYGEAEAQPRRIFCRANKRGNREPLRGTAARGISPCRQNRPECSRLYQTPAAGQRASSA